MVLSENDRYILDHRVRPLVTPELIAEQRDRPFGPQSTAMKEVLDFLRRSPDPELPRYIVLDLDGDFELAVRSDRPGGPPVPLSPRVTYPDRGAAEHAVFLLRLTDHGVI
ncbi:hypothetical protein VD659_10865 [Herbiconiux sp. 11R-BC]|uniref:hypothetical protein n=1 Tax=Herbiconiux sp. 11R-BC TaxID=3111637 RepID=UPI003C0B5771